MEGTQSGKEFTAANGPALDIAGRRQERHATSVLINARIEQDGRDGLCRIRNVSEGGVAIETSLPIVRGHPVRITLQSGRILDCEARWTEGSQAGMACQQIATDVLREERAHPAPDAPALPRFARSAAAEIVIVGRAQRCELVSISTTDALVRGAPALAAGQPATLRVSGLDDAGATVRGPIGALLLLGFSRPLPFRMLDPWLAR